MITRYRDACRVNLCKAWICKTRTTAIRTESSGHITTNRISGQVVDIAIPSRAKQHRIRSPNLQFSSGKVTGNNTLGMSIDHNEVEHLLPHMHFHLSGGNLTTQRTVGTEEQLLASLPAGVKGTAYLSSTK